MTNLIINAPTALSINSINAQNESPLINISYSYFSNGIWGPDSNSPVILYSGGSDNLTYDINLRNIGSGAISLSPYGATNGSSLLFTTVGGNGSGLINPDQTSGTTAVTVSIGGGATYLTFNFIYDLYEQTNPSAIYNNGNTNVDFNLTGSAGQYSATNQEGSILINSTTVSGTFDITIIATQTYIIITSFIFTPNSPIPQSIDGNLSIIFYHGDTATLSWTNTFTTPLLPYTLTFSMYELG